MNNDITLPLELFDGRLTLLEVGTISILMSTPHLSQEELAIWEGDGMLKETFDEMVERGIIKHENNQWILYIDKEEKKTNMKIEQALNELFEAGVLDGDNKSVIRDILEEVAADFYNIGYEDGRVDFQEDTPFTAYGKAEDFV